MSTTFSVRMDTELLEALREVAKEQHFTGPGALIRFLCAQYVRRERQAGAA